ncbi:hypothetical protein LEP1GSC036_4793 [Leptospira weilii str. 2006001853]|uniref:Uncharacterized protein n=2 Tax=Leptospira weilii TaxID=28184 RepID=A0A828Z355_9LEPT|nr:hypothetical protein LEP1GSC036_4793 [Leptospira weilii str. 2006001853]EMY15847.1 hypothetical protein LEP1GSC043_0985 [Leptospira weilii str. Ecochallenge]
MQSTSQNDVPRGKRFLKQISLWFENVVIGIIFIITWTNEKNTIISLFQNLEC